MFRTLLNRFDNQTLTSSELRYWAKRATYGQSRFWRMVQNVFVGTIAALSALLFVYELIAVQLNFDFWQYVNFQLPRNSPIPLLFTAAIVFVVSAYSLPFTRTRMLVRQVIARDKTRKDGWEMIVLTGVDSRSYVRAKWWTVMRMIAPQMLPSAIIRAGLVAFIVGELSRNGAFMLMIVWGNNPISSPSVWDILLLGVLSLILPFLALPGAVIGSIDDMLDFPRHGNTWWNWTLRGFVSALEGLITFGIIIILFITLTLMTSNVLVLLLVAVVLWTAVDNGLTVTGLLALYTFFNPGMAPIIALFDNAGMVIMIILLSLPLVALRAWARLKLAERTGQRHGLVKIVN